MALQINDIIGNPEENEYTLKLWRQGITGLNPEQVSEAIQRGVDVDTPYAFYEKNSPLINLLTEHSYLYSDHTGPLYSDDKVQDRQAIRDITYMILDEDPDLLAEIDEFGERLVDKLMASAYDQELAADVAIKGIYDHMRIHGEELSINYSAIFAGLGTPDAPYHDIREETLDLIKTVHNIVGEKLSNPDTLYAQQLKESYPDVAEQWMQSFQRPDLGELPTPSREFTEAVSKMGNALGSIINEPGFREGNISIDPASLRKAENAMGDSIRAAYRQRQQWSGPGGS